MTQSAALAFYMIFSWPSILLIILWTVSRFYREVAIRDALFNESGGIVGHQGEKTRKLGDFIVGSNEEGFTFTDEDAP